MAWSTESISSSNNGYSAVSRDDTLDSDFPPTIAATDEPLLVDVRSYAEFMTGHIAGAHSLPLPQLEQEVIHKIPDRSAAVLLYCSSGARSEQALGLMQQLGYTNARNGGGATHLAQALHKAIQTGL